MGAWEYLFFVWITLGVMVVVLGTWHDPKATWREFADGGGLVVFVLAVILWPLALWVIITHDH